MWNNNKERKRETAVLDDRFCELLHNKKSCYITDIGSQGIGS